jgi:ABC-type Mn2+/Zn2+ transport system permease subunit
VCGAVTTTVFAWYRREILLSSVDPEFLRTLGRNPARYDAILYVLLGVAISLGVMLAGPLVVFGFLVLPGIAALRLAGSIAGAFAIACAVAAAASLGGFALAWRADLPAGPVEVALAATPWLIAGSFSVARRLARSLT